MRFMWKSNSPRFCTQIYHLFEIHSSWWINLISNHIVEWRNFCIFQGNNNDLLLRYLKITLATTGFFTSLGFSQYLWMEDLIYFPLFSYFFSFSSPSKAALEFHCFIMFGFGFFDFSLVFFFSFSWVFSDWWICKMRIFMKLCLDISLFNYAKS